MKGVGNKKECHHENDKASHFILDRVAAINLLLTGLGIKDVQVPHEDGEDVRDGYAREDAHHRGQHQHKTNHYTLNGGGAGGTHGEMVGIKCDVAREGHQSASYAN